MKESTILIIIGSVFVLIGLIFLPVAWRKISDDIASKRWPQTAATLKDVEVVKYIHERGEKEHYRQFTGYSCRLVYEYHAVGRDHTAEHHESARDREDAVRIAATHKAGERRTLYYNPEAPERYRVEAVSGYAGLLWLLPFAGFAGFGWLVIWVGRRFYGE